MITQIVTDSFKLELLSGIHDFSSDTFKLALYGPNADLGHSTTVYSATEESSGDNYTAGGVTVSASISTAGEARAVYVELSDVTVASTTVTTRGALLYNSSKANRSVLVLDFGINIVKSSTDLVLTFGSALRDNSVLVIK